MRKLLLLAIFFGANTVIINLASQSEASALDYAGKEQQTIAFLTNKTDENNEDDSVELVKESSKQVTKEVKREKQDEEKTKTEPPTKHSVQKGENLSKIAKQYNIEWLRIWEKNTDLKDPDVITVGDILVIPRDNEKLESRPLPQVEVENTQPAEPQTRSSENATRPQQVSNNQPQAAPKPSPIRTASRGSSSGNTYTAGYCTWYAKNRRPDLPNNLGNASTWVSRARAQGIATGSQPRVGAIGQQGNHVVYIERVNSNGTVTVSEMNWSGLFVISSRTTAASNFTYIY